VALFVLQPALTLFFVDFGRFSRDLFYGPATQRQPRRDAARVFWTRFTGLKSYQPAFVQKLEFWRGEHPLYEGSRHRSRSKGLEHGLPEPDGPTGEGQLAALRPRPQGDISRFVVRLQGGEETRHQGTKKGSRGCSVWQRGGAVYQARKEVPQDELSPRSFGSCVPAGDGAKQKLSNVSIGVATKSNLRQLN
jgi:hypothetical protein